ncbi:hypothetical protein G4B84_007052 [Aspergillus flavus NRRL3357]|nr:uncharacterized protein G4B84_007052 [Aspergillus flavus NRRL3357]QMW31671.1 hypothetical protein G4B84_007052 [Aspergillus flavus NRRL3357]
MSLDLVGIIFLADLSLIAQRTALTGGSTFLDTFILCPGLHRQQDAANVHRGEYPAVAAMTTGYVFRVENPATVNFLQRVGHTGQLTTLSVTNTRKTRKGWRSHFMSSIDSSMSLGAVAAYLLAVSSTIAVSYLLVLTEDWWGLLVLTVLMFTRFINVLLIRSRSRVGWSGASEPGVVGDLLVLLSQDRWVRIRGYVDDLKAVTSGEWLHDMTWVESAISGFTTLLVYLNVALASNAKLSGQVMLLLLFVGTGGLLGLVNMLTQGLQMHGNLITVDIPRRKYRRRLDLVEALICETGRDDWAWVLSGTCGIDSLQLQDVPIPDPGDYEVLVKFHAASLNFRDIMIANGQYYIKTKDRVIPGSDAAGEIVKVGPKVTRFSTGQRVSPIFHLTHLYGSVKDTDIQHQLGGTYDGVFCEYGVFNEHGCVEIPSTLSYREAATLPCAALTAWNALYGGPRKLKPGDVVLTQGSGGVSIFALQFAKLGGAQVISTTSNAEKGAKLRDLGADVIINYAEDSEWGQTAKSQSHRKRGADFVVEIANTMVQSSQAVANNGCIATIGRRGDSERGAGSSHSSVLATVRRILVGNRQLQEDMNAAIEVSHLKPQIDGLSFKFHELKEAYDYFQQGSHFGKVVVDFD